MPPHLLSWLLHCSSPSARVSVTRPHLKYVNALPDRFPPCTYFYFLLQGKGTWGWLENTPPTTITRHMLLW